jgi:hypothetical protein
VVETWWARVSPGEVSREKLEVWLVVLLGRQPWVVGERIQWQCSQCYVLAVTDCWEQVEASRQLQRLFSVGELALKETVT